MKATQRFSRSLSVVSLALICLAPRLAIAYPPAPDHIFQGIVRDEMGNPLRVDNATVILETATGIQITAEVSPSVQADANYHLAVPMDAGITADPYKPTAISPTVKFRFRVRIGQVMYLPIQIKADYSLLGQPGQHTRLDLTLGEDTDGDGLPDAWERALLASRGGGTDIRTINPNDDFDKDGLSNMDEYIAGTYAFDPKDSFELKITAFKAGTPIFQFMAITGRTYYVLGSSDMREWSPVSFQISGGTGETISEYDATDVRVVKVEVPASTGSSASLRFFKLKVQ